MFHKDASRYSDDRLALAQEIMETLKKRGYWVPALWSGPDIITAVAMALDRKCVSENCQGKAEYCYECYRET